VVQRLTPAAERLVEHTEAILERLEQAQADLDASAATGLPRSAAPPASSPTSATRAPTFSCTCAWSAPATPSPFSPPCCPLTRLSTSATCRVPRLAASTPPPGAAPASNPP